LLGDRLCPRRELRGGGAGRFCFFEVLRYPKGGRNRFCWATGVAPTVSCTLRLEEFSESLNIIPRNAYALSR
jgi:hypothetical protein